MKHEYSITDLIRNESVEVLSAAGHGLNGLAEVDEAHDFIYWDLVEDDVLCIVGWEIVTEVRSLTPEHYGWDALE